MIAQPIMMKRLISFCMSRSSVPNIIPMISPMIMSQILPVFIDFLDFATIKTSIGMLKSKTKITMLLISLKKKARIVTIKIPEPKPNKV